MFEPINSFINVCRDGIKSCTGLKSEYMAKLQHKTITQEEYELKLKKIDQEKEIWKEALKKLESISG